ncbi:MAG: ABC transporter substrate-binding protein [Syntrophales bacterium]|nr:ABC transporter substrate-binding protein [Syntrophales bacterium]MDD5232153.1 ABC transporter substrate-binding protein [Syntrophales bacterium]MDD5533349.1 ABC transporter substrate-binding protein [Syntrophales bacterium]
MKNRLLLLLILVCVTAPLPAYAGPPTEAVRANVDKVLNVLRDPALKPESAREKKKKRLEAIYEVMFDEIELSRRTLGLNWNKLTPDQRREFVHLYRQVLENAYIDKILSYTNEKIVFTREIKISENQAEVQTRIITSSREVPISYRVIRKDGAWRVYDVIVENVSLVRNYRSQFNQILSKNTPPQLIEILRKRVKQIK